MSGKIKVILLLLIIIISLSNTSVILANSLINEEMEIVAENNYLSLYLDKTTTKFAIKNKESGDLWFSNPPLSEENEDFVSGKAKEKLNEQLRIYYDRVGEREDLSLSNLQSSVELGLFEIKNIENGVRINYEFGQKWEEEDFLPKVISEKEMEKIFVELKTKDKKMIEDNFTLVEVKEIKNWEKKLEIGSDNLNFFEEYSILSKESKNLAEEIDTELKAGKNKDDIIEKINKYNILKDNLSWHLLRLIESNKWNIDNSNQINNQILMSFLEAEQPFYILNEGIFPFLKSNLIATIKGSGYTPEQVAVNHSEFNIDPPQANTEVFKVPIEYSLDRGDFIVRIPAEDIKFPNKVKDITGKLNTSFLHKINLTPYFGAVHRDKKDGYIFVPDGSGALIDFNDKSSIKTYISNSFFGEDIALENKDTKNRIIEQLYLPVYGLKTGDKGFLAIIEEGAELANLNAYKADVKDSYNTIFPSFNLLPKGEVKLDSLGSVTMYQEKFYKGDIKVRYKFLDKESANYVGMANNYRNYLVDKYKLKKLSSTEEIPIFVELTGGILKTKRILGYPTETVEPLTKYEEVNKITDKLNNNGINNINIFYRGWMEGGVETKLRSKLKLSDQLGSKEDFNNLIKDAVQNNVQFYPEVNFLKYNKSESLFNFGSENNNSHYFGGQAAKAARYNIAEGTVEKEFMLLSPNALNDFVDSFITNQKKFNINNILLEDAGKTLYSDMALAKENIVIRSESKDIIDSTLKEIKKKDTQITVKGANEYVLPWVNNILEAPSSSSNFKVFNKSIPFYQIVLSGYYNYASYPLNINNKDNQYLFLKMIETGSIPYFSWINGESRLLKDSEYNNLYSLGIDSWIDQGVDYYSKANKVLSDLTNKVIIDHQNIEKNVYKTTFENGVSIVVNYNDNEIQINDVVVAGNSFIRIDN